MEIKYQNHRGRPPLTYCCPLVLVVGCSDLFPHLDTHHVPVPMMQVPQLPLLNHFSDYQPHLFHKKLCVDPQIFDRILEQISGSDIFIPKGNRPQLPISIQLAIFLNCAGHYGNAISLEDIAQWASVSVGSVRNCSNQVMVALLQQHDHFLAIPAEDSEDAEIT